MALGRVAGAHGLRGQLRVRVLADAGEVLERLSRVTLASSEDAEDAAEFEVAGVAAGRSGEMRLALVGIGGREAAEALRGRLVMTDAASLGALPEGEYYGYQLIGCRVEGDDGRQIGTVRDIWRTGAPDVLVVEDDDGGEHLIPAAEALLQEVDVAGGRIVIEVIPGLLEPT